MAPVNHGTRELPVLKTQFVTQVAPPGIYGSETQFASEWNANHTHLYRILLLEPKMETKERPRSGPMVQTVFRELVSVPRHHLRRDES